MAIFNPEPNPDNIPNYLSYSKGTNIRMADDSWGALFKGAANTIDAGVKGIDTIFKINVDKAVDEGVASERDPIVDPIANRVSQTGNFQEGVENGKANSDLTLYANAKGGGPGMVAPPPAVEAAVDNMKRITDAKNGGMNEAYYQARLENVVRSIKQQYPGYTDYIDQKIQEKTGIIPANAVVKSVFQDISQLQTNAQKDSDRAYQLAHTSPYLPKNAWEQYQRGNLTLNQMVQMHSAGISGKEVDENQLRQMNIRSQEKKLATEEWSPILTTRFGNVVTNHISRMSGSAGGFEALSKQVNDAQISGTPLSGPQLQLISGRLEADDRELRLAMWKDANTVQVDPKTGQKMFGGRTLSAIVGDEEIGKKIDAAMLPYTQLKKAIRDKDFGAAFATANSNEVEKNNNISLVTGMMPTANVIEALNHKVGPQNTAWLFKADSGMLTSIGKEAMAMRKQFQANAANGGIESMEQGRQIQKKWQGLTPQDKTSFGELLGDIVNPLTRENLHPTIQKNYLNILFGPKNNELLDHFDSNDQRKIYFKVVNDDMTNVVKKLNDPEVTRNYQMWSLDNAKRLFATTFKDVSDDNKFTRGVELKYDTTTAQLSALNAPWGYIGSNLDNNVRALNPVLANLKNALSIGNTGDKVSAGMLDFLKEQGIDPSREASGGAKEDDFIHKVGKAIWNSLQEGAGNVKDNFEKNHPPKDQSRVEPDTKFVLFNGQKVKAQKAPDGQYYTTVNGQNYLVH